MFRVRLFFPSLSHVLARDLVAVWVWNLDRWLSLQKFWESRSGTAEERPDTESTALDGAEAAKSPTSATSAKHLDIFSSFFHMISHVLASTVFHVFPCISVLFKFFSSDWWNLRDYIGIASLLLVLETLSVGYEGTAKNGRRPWCLSEWDMSCLLGCLLGEACRCAILVASLLSLLARICQDWEDYWATYSAFGWEFYVHLVTSASKFSATSLFPRGIRCCLAVVPVQLLFTCAEYRATIIESESFTWSGQRQEHSSSKVYLTLWWPQVSCTVGAKRGFPGKPWGARKHIVQTCGDWFFGVSRVAVQLLLGGSCSQYTRLYE